MVVGLNVWIVEGKLWYTWVINGLGYVVVAIGSKGYSCLIKLINY